MVCLLSIVGWLGLGVAVAQFGHRHRRNRCTDVVMPGLRILTVERFFATVFRHSGVDARVRIDIEYFNQHIAVAVPADGVDTTLLVESRRRTPLRRRQTRGVLTA